MKTLVFLLAVVALAACGSDSPAERYDKIATGFCGCTGSLVALNQKAVALVNDTTGQAAQVFMQIQVEYLRAKACSAELTAQHGKLKSEEFDAFRSTLSGKCPELAEADDWVQEMLGE